MHSIQNITPSRLIKINEVMQMTGLAKSTIYKYINDTEKAFPKQIKIGHGCFWLQQEIFDWINQHVENRDKK